MPGTPVQPTVAFDFLVMEAMHVAFNSSQSSYELFSKLLNGLHSSWLEVPSMVKQELYEALTLVARPYAILRRDFLSHAFEDSAGAKCPRCPICVPFNQDAAPRCVHLDGCFGISHFKKAGKGHSEPVYGGSMIMLNQENVDKFESSFSSTDTSDKKRTADEETPAADEDTSASTVSGWEGWGVWLRSRLFAVLVLRVPIKIAMIRLALRCTRLWRPRIAAQT